MNSITITKSLLKSWLTPRGGYTGAQLRLMLPLIDESPRELRAGWPDRLVGVIISPEQQAEIVAARAIYSSRKRTAEAQAELGVAQTEPREAREWWMLATPSGYDVWHSEHAARDESRIGQRIIHVREQL